MAREHKPGRISEQELLSCKQELLQAIEEIDATLLVMKRVKVKDLYVFHLASLNARDGGRRKIDAFVRGLYEAKRRLVAGKPITANETKGAITLEDNQAAESNAAAVAEEESVYEAFQQVLGALSPEVRKRVAEKMLNEPKEAPRKKSKSSPR